jgi:hypothetical protein
MYFTAWIEEAQRLEKERMANANAEVISHPGFGQQDETIETDWANWMEYVLWLNDGSPDEQAELEASVALGEDDED